MQHPFQLSTQLLFTASHALLPQLVEADEAKPLAAYAIVVFEIDGVQAVRIASACTKPCAVDLDALRAALATIPSPAPEEG